MGDLAGRVAIVTGTASGIGREHALLLAARGAAIVANDFHDADPLVRQIVAAGGRAVASSGDVADWGYAEELVRTAVESFGSLDVVVNNAGVAGDALLWTMSEADFDRNISVNLKGAFAPTRAAVSWWQEQRAAGREVKASVINTTSGAGLLGNPGQTHYGAAKAGVAAMTMIAAAELAGTGIRVNAVAPAARTPMSGEGSQSAVARFMAPPAEADAFDAWHPGNISPLVAYLADADCPITGQVFHVRGGVIAHFEGWTVGGTIAKEGRWTVDEIARQLPAVVAAAPDRRDAGGPVYAALRGALADERLGPSA